ncbi:MAG: AI-2E family transporter [Bacteroidota bacterium]
MNSGDFPHHTAILVAAVFLLAALAYAVQPILSPFVLVGALVYLLSPFDDLLSRRIMWLGVLLFTLWFLYSILGLLAPFIVAFLVAYILNPFVTRLEQRKIPRWASSLVIVVVLVGTVVWGVLFLLPIVAQEFRGILSGINLIARDVAEILKSGSIFSILERYGVPVDEARAMITEQVSPRLENVLTHLFEGVFGFVTGVSSIVLQIINAVIIPFLVFYMLMDFPLITERFARLASPRKRTRFVSIASKADEIIGRYLRGAIVVAMIQGSISALVLWFLGVQYALVLGIMTGILNFIPYVGLITSLVVSCIVALFSGEPVLVKVVGVIILYLSQKLLEATVLGPKIIGREVGLHPVLLILCLLVFGYFLGFVGLLIAVPATALIIAAVNEWEATRDAVEQLQPQEK